MKSAALFHRNGIHLRAKLYYIIYIIIYIIARRATRKADYRRILCSTYYIIHIKYNIQTHANNVPTTIWATEPVDNTRMYNKIMFSNR